MRILVGTTSYSMAEGDPGLVNDLVRRLAVDGHICDVLFIDWAEGRGVRHGSVDGVDVIRVSPVGSWVAGKMLRLAAKWSLSGFWALAEFKRAWGEREYDLIITFSPAWIFSPIVAEVKRVGAGALLVYWDFFPRHQIELGILPRGGVEWVARRLETAAVLKMDRIGLMTVEYCTAFLKEFPGVPSSRLAILPLWSSAGQIDPAPGSVGEVWAALRREGPLVVFGGQLTEGRGFDELLDAASELTRRGLRAVFIVAGDGRLREVYERRALERGLSCVRFIGRLPRVEYFGLLSVADLALVLTASNVDAPSFPSKTVDYACAGLPIVASTDEGGGFGRVLEEYDAGVWIRGGDGARVADAIEGLLLNDALRAKLSAGARRMACELFSGARLIEIVRELADCREVSGELNE